jgi:hypothetical protein
VPLSDAGSFDLGDDVRIDFRVAGLVLVLTVTSGLDRGATLLAAAEGEVIDLAPAGIGGDLLFQRGRPWLSTGASGTLLLGGEPIRHGRVQLVRGDRAVVDGEELDVA